MSVLKEFRDFAFKGNMIDLAVGVIIGASFGKVISSLVDNICMPLIGAFTTGIDLKDLKKEIILPEATGLKPVVVPYGMFLQEFLTFLIVALVIFVVVVKVMGAIRRLAAAPSPTTKECPFCRMAVPIAATKCGHCTSSL